MGFFETLFNLNKLLDEGLSMGSRLCSSELPIDPSSSAHEYPSMARDSASICPGTAALWDIFCCY